MPPASFGGFELNGFKREELIATSSMPLHELFCDGLGTDRTAMAPAMELALAGSFGLSLRQRHEQQLQSP